jgi:hypothetical protein
MSISGTGIDADHHPILYIHEFEQYLIPLLFVNKNKHIQDKLHHWFPNKNVATVLINWLLHPQNDIWSEIVKSWLIKTRKGNNYNIIILLLYYYYISTCVLDHMM